MLGVPSWPSDVVGDHFTHTANLIALLRWYRRCTTVFALLLPFPPSEIQFGSVSSRPLRRTMNLLQIGDLDGSGCTFHYKVQLIISDAPGV